MIQKLEMKGTADTPDITLDGQNGNLEITGRALTDDARKSFKPVLDWLKEYAKSPQPNTQLSFKLEYLNTDSSKLILDILTILEQVPGAKVCWYFKDEDEDMEETGEELAELVKVPFEFRTY